MASNSPNSSDQCDCFIMASSGKVTPSKDQGNMTDDILTLQWDDEPSQHNGGDSSADTVESSANTGSTDTMESKIDKMLTLYLSLNEKLSKSTSTSKERLSEVKVGHNTLVSVIKAQRGEIVERIRKILKKILTTQKGYS